MGPPPPPPAPHPTPPHPARALQEVVLESPFKDFSLQEVAHLLRFLYNPGAAGGWQRAGVCVGGIARMSLQGVARLLRSFETNPRCGPARAIKSKHRN